MTSIKSIYTMGPLALRIACRKAGVEKNTSSKLWDALWYRASVLSPNLSVSDVSIIVDTMRVFPKFKSPLLAAYLIKNLNFKKDSIMDYTMLLRNIYVLKLDPELENKIIHNLSRKDWDKNISFNDIEKIISLKKSEILRPILTEIILEKLKRNKINDPKIAVNIFQWFYEEPFFQNDTLLNTCVSLSSKFSTQDIVVFASCKIPSTVSVISRQILRLALEFKPDHITSLICISDPKLFPINITALVAEFEYKIRYFHPVNCVKIWQHLTLYYGVAPVNSILARLLKYDTNTTLKGTDLETLVSLLKSNQDNPRTILLLKQLAPDIKNRTNIL